MSKKTTTDSNQTAVANTNSSENSNSNTYGLSGGNSYYGNSVGATDAALEHINPALSSLRGAYGQGAGLLSQYMPQVNAGLSGILANYGHANPALTASNNYASSVLNGDYLGGNPYLQQALHSAAQDAMDMTNATVGGRGAAGGSEQANLVSRNISNAQNNLLLQNYMNERGLMGQAAGIGANNANAQNNMNTGTLQQLYSTVTLPQQMAAQYGQGVQGLVGGWTQNNGYAGNNAYNLGNTDTTGNSTSNTTGTQTGHSVSTESGGLLGSIIGGLAQLGSAAITHSDRRLKSDIVKLGEEMDGLGVYEYIIGGERQRGVMADEVAQLRPWALGPVRDGYATVDYSKLMEAA